MDGLNHYLRGDKFAQHVNVELLNAADGAATARLEIQEHHLNSHSTVHGAAIFALADTALEAASNSHGVVAVAINVTISFLKAASAGVLTAQATELSLNPILAVYEVRITSHTAELIAIFQGMVYRKKQKIEA